MFVELTTATLNFSHSTSPPLNQPWYVPSLLYSTVQDWSDRTVPMSVIASDVQNRPEGDLDTSIH